MIALIIPAYNEEAELPICLASLSRQNNRNFKLILVNNASNDTTRDIMVKFAKSKILDTVILDEFRIGKLNALRTALEYVKNDPKIEILAFSDADSYFEKNWSTKVNTFFKNNSEVSFGYTTEIFKEEQLKSVPNFKTALREYTKLLYFVRSEIAGYMNLGNCFVTKDFFFRIGGFDNWTKSLDTLLTIKLISKGYKGGYCNAKVWFSPRRLLDNNNMFKWCTDSDIRQFTIISGFKTWKPVRIDKLKKTEDIFQSQITRALIIKSERLFRRLLVLYLYELRNDELTGFINSSVKLNYYQIKLLRLIAKFLSVINVKMSYNVVDKIIRKYFTLQIRQGGRNIFKLGGINSNGTTRDYIQATLGSGGWGVNVSIRASA